MDWIRSSRGIERHSRRLREKGGDSRRLLVEIQLGDSRSPWRKRGGRHLPHPRYLRLANAATGWSTTVRLILVVVTTGEVHPFLGPRP